jgi:FecR protein
MILRMLKVIIPCIFASAAWLESGKAEEPLKVGLAEIVRNEVVNVGGAELIPINVGDDVVRDEIIRTGPNSDAKFGLTDQTKLTLGPGSTLKIDRAVYSDGSRYKQVTIRLTEGAFRFITGNSDKKSYKIETPFASIGVRGTILDIRISQTQTLVTLQDGKASVCAGAQCTQLVERGQTANLTREGNVTRIHRDLVPTWTFASVCAGNSALCSPLPALTKKANLAPLLPGSGAGKKGAPTRLCSDGQPMVGNSCGSDLKPSRDASLPLPSNLSRDASIPIVNSPTAPATGTLLGPTGLPSTGSLPSSSPRLSPLLRR